jgi:hypothetical protein
VTEYKGSKEYGTVLINELIASDYEKTIWFQSEPIIKTPKIFDSRINETSITKIKEHATFKELKEAINKCKKEYFENNKIKKSEFFKDMDKAPKWIADEFVIIKRYKSEYIPSGKCFLYPLELEHQDLSFGIRGFETYKVYDEFVMYESME